MQKLQATTMAKVEDERRNSNFDTGILSVADLDFGEILSCGQSLRHHANLKGNSTFSSRVARKGCKEQMVQDIESGNVVQTRRGIGDVRRMTICYLPLLFDMHYGDGKPGYCFLSNTKCPAWGRYRLEECRVVL